jgi:proteasome lid subunit RPN8/RPN11
MTRPQGITGSDPGSHPAPCRLDLPRAVDEELRAYASAHYPLEACGLVLGERDASGIRITRAVPCENIAERSRRGYFFLIDPRVVLNAARSPNGGGEGLVGFVHSHPNAAAEPSSADMAFIRLWPQTVWLIVSVRDGIASTPRAWWLDNPHQDAACELPISIVPTANERHPGQDPTGD